MTNRRTRLFLWVAGSAAVASAFLAIWRSGLLGSTRSSSPENERRAYFEDRLQAGARDYAALDMTPIESIASADDMMTHFGEQVLEALGRHTELTREDARQLAELASGFVYHRFVRDDPDAYIRWRLDNGYRWIDPEAMRRSLIAQDWGHTFGERPYPGDDNPAEAFRVYWEYRTPTGAHAPTVTGVATMPRAIGVGVALGSEVGWSRPEPVSAREDMVWVGSTGSLRSWFAPGGTDISKLRKSPQGVTLVTIAFVLELADNRRTPMALYGHRERGGRWWIGGVGLLNMEPRFGPAPEV